jgi:hypothetical protein
MENVPLGLVRDRTIDRKYVAMRAALKTLLAAKAEKEVNGKTDKYIKLRDRGWEMAKESMKD